MTVDAAIVVLEKNGYTVALMYPGFYQLKDGEQKDLGYFAANALIGLALKLAR